MKCALFVCLLGLTSCPALTAAEIARQPTPSPLACAETDEGLSFPEPTVLARELSAAPRLFKAIAERQPRVRSYERTKAALVAGDNPNQCGPYGLTPLQLAAGSGRRDLMALLIKHGAQIDTPLSASGNTALGIAIIGRQWSSAEYLLGVGASATTIDHYGESVLHLLAFPGRDAAEEKAKSVLISRVVQQGSPLNHQGDRGLTPLMIAAALNNVSAVKQLLLLGADPAVRNRKGQTARDLAQRQHHQAVLDVFNKH